MLINWNLIYSIYVQFVILIMFDVKLTPSGRSVDHLPICMNE